MLKNLPYIASQAFNRPVALEPSYARVFYSVLANEMGIGRLVDGMTGEVLDSDLMKQEAANYRLSNASKSDIDEERGRYYQLVDGVAVLPVSGTTAHKVGSIRPYSGMTGYDGLIKRVEFALKDHAVKGIMFDFDSPGGQVAGCFDAVDTIAKYRNIKPIWSLGFDMHCSAAQALSSACSRRLITQTGIAGSVGVVMMHANMEEMMKNRGAEITFIHSGAHKVDGNPYQKLPTDVREKLQAELDSTRQLFAEKVAANIGLTVQQVLDTEAQTYIGKDAVDIGFCDEVVNGSDAIAIMAEHVAQRKIFTTGGFMPKGQEAVATEPKVTAKTESVTEYKVDVSAVAKDERERVLGIIGCDEAKGREAMAHKLAGMPSMSVDDAKELLAAAPKTEPKAKDDTASVLAALSAEHGETLEADNDSDVDDDQKQCAALLSAIGKRK